MRDKNTVSFFSFYVPTKAITTPSGRSVCKFPALSKEASTKETC